MLPLDACVFDNYQILGAMIFAPSDSLGPLLGGDGPKRLSLAVLFRDNMAPTFFNNL
jgi:hypothetical protein